MKFWGGFRGQGKRTGMEKEKGMDLWKPYDLQVFFLKRKNLG